MSLPTKKQVKAKEVDSSFFSPVNDTPTEVDESFFSPIDEKKKNGGNNSLNGAGTPTSKSPSAFAGIDPTEQFSNGKITTPSGVDFAIDENKIPAPLRTPDFIQSTQARISQGIVTPQDQDAITLGTGKKKEAVSAYLIGDNKTGEAYDIQQSAEKQTDSLKNIIGDFNKQKGTMLNADELIADPEKLSNWATTYVEELKKGIDDNNMSGAGVYAPIGSGVGQYINESQKKKSEYKDILTQFINDKKPVIDSRITDQTILQHWSDGTFDREGAVNTIAKRLDPIGYKNAEDALSIKQGTDDLSDQSSVGKMIGGLYDELNNNTKDKEETLNSVKGYADIQMNNSLQRLSTQMAAKAHISNNPELKLEAEKLNQQYDPNVINNYPAILLQQMAAEISTDVARDNGNLEGSNGLMDETSLFGETREGYETRMKNKGWFNDPAKKDLAEKLLNNPSLFSDASYTGSILKSAAQPIKDLFSATASIAGIRDKKDVIYDKIKDELHPIETPGLTGFVKGVRTVANTSANLASMIGIGAATAGIGRVAGIGLEAGEVLELSKLSEGIVEGADLERKAALLSKLASSQGKLETLSNFGSFGLPSVKSNLEDSYNFIDNDAKRAIYVGMGAVLNTFGGKLLNLPKLSTVEGLPEVFTKFVNGVTDKTLTQESGAALLNEGKQKWVDAAVKYGKNVTEGAAVMAYFTASNQILKSAFGDPNTNSDEIIKNTGHAFLDGLLGMMVFGAIKTRSEMNENTGSIHKANIYDMTVVPDATKDIMRMGAKSDEDLTQKMQILNTAVAAKNALNSTISETGIDLSYDQKAVYVSNKTVESYIRKNIETMPEGEAKNKLIERADKLRDQSIKTLDGLQFTPTLEPLYDLYDAEKSYDKALSDHTSTPTAETEKALVDSKAVYEGLQNKYFGDQYKANPVADKIPSYKIDGKEVPKDEFIQTMNSADAGKLDMVVENDDATSNQLEKIGGKSETINDAPVKPTRLSTQPIETTTTDNTTTVNVDQALNDKLGKGALMGIDNTDDALKLIAQQAHEVANDGTEVAVKSPDPVGQTERSLGENGKEIVAAAMTKYPRESLLEAGQSDAPVSTEEVATKVGKTFRTKDEMLNIYNEKVPNKNEVVSHKDMFGNETESRIKDVQRDFRDKHNILEKLINCLTK